MSHRLHGINYRVLTTMLVVALPVLVIGSYVVIERGQTRLLDAFGVKLSQRAEQSAAAIDAYVYRQVVDVSTLARVPEIRAEAEQGSRRPASASHDAELDRAFGAREIGRADVAAILGTPASKFFADITRQDPIYRELLLTDRWGRLVAASNLPSDYRQDDEAWWRRVMADPTRGEATVGDVRWDDSARMYGMEFAVPVPGADERPVGVLKVVADVREMLASVAGMDLGDAGDAMLVRHNGSIVFSRDAVQPSARFFAADRLRERLDAAAATAGPATLYFTATDATGVAEVVGVATSQLSSTYPHLPWAVVAWQPEDDLLAPVRSQSWSLLALLGLTGFCVIAAAAWFSITLAPRPIDTEMHLVPHAPIHRFEEESV